MPRLPRNSQTCLLTFVGIGRMMAVALKVCNAGSNPSVAVYYLFSRETSVGRAGGQHLDLWTIWPIEITCCNPPLVLYI